MFAVIYLPNFLLQAALRHEPELFLRPVALLDEEIKTIVELTAVAGAAGICKGLNSTQALARCPNILIKSRSAVQEEAATNLLLECAYAFSPNIESTAPGICTLDLKGLNVLPSCTRQNRNIGTERGCVADQPQRVTTPIDSAIRCGWSETTQPRSHISADRMSAARWVQQILAQLASLNLRAQIGIAENPDLALHAAKIARPFFLVENSNEFISSLPIESIEASPEILDILHRWGIRTLGEFTALQKNNLAERLGAESLELFDRATANTIRPLELVRPKEVFEESIEFEHEIETLQPLLFILRRFIEQLSRRLELFQLVAQEIQLRLTLSSGEKLERHFRIPSPTRNIETLFRTLQTNLETVQTDSPIVALHLSAKPSKPEHFQFGLFETALRDPNQFYETLAQLTSLLGANRVGTPVVENTFRPDAFRMGPVNFEGENVLPSCTRQKASDNTTCFISQTRSAECNSAALSLRRFRPPSPAIIEMRNGKPALLNSEKFVGAIAEANGPFRSSGNWWEQNQLWSRDEWDIETSSGELFRVFTQNGEWFLEGAFD
jgi:protein ImuB